MVMVAISKGNKDTEEFPRNSILFVEVILLHYLRKKISSLNSEHDDKRFHK